MLYWMFSDFDFLWHPIFDDIRFFMPSDFLWHQIEEHTKLYTPDVAQLPRPVYLEFHLHKSEEEVHRHQ